MPGSYLIWRNDFPQRLYDLCSRRIFLWREVMRKTSLIALAFAAFSLAPAALAQNQEDPAGSMMGGRMGQGMMMNCPMSGMMGGAHDYVEGRIAFLKAELHITSAQEKAWSDYANELRSVRESAPARMGQMMGQTGQMGQMMQGDGMQGAMGRGMMMGGGGDRQPAPDALKARIDAMEGRLANLKKLQAATAKLYSALSDEQKATADDLLGPRCGMAWM
jgi:hypothetical protein